ncbi:MAG TPA: hypothetical protein VMH77_08580 [Steroidobacteraceae bacterium]|nr:hypothetical protein [Steroidobacteraceae bacterium]
MPGPQYYFAGPQTASPAPIAVLGRGPQSAPEPLQVLTTLDEVRAASRRAVASAQRLLSIYSLDLEPKLYEHGPFLDTVQRFLLSHSFAKIRLLTQRPVPYTSQHKLAAMRRRLSGHIEIRTVAAEFAARTSGMLIADSRAIVYRAQVTSWEGVAGFEQPPIARLYQQEFDEMWLASVPKY